MKVDFVVDGLTACLVLITFIYICGAKEYDPVIPKSRFSQLSECIIFDDAESAFYSSSCFETEFYHSLITLLLRGEKISNDFFDFFINFNYDLKEFEDLSPSTDAARIYYSFD